MRIFKRKRISELDKKAQKIFSKKQINEMHLFKNINCYVHETARIQVRGSFTMNASNYGNRNVSSNIRLDSNAVLNVKHNFSFYYGADIICLPNAVLDLGSGFCNCNVKIRCKKHISIGEDVAISHNVTIMDTDAHEIIKDNYKNTEPVFIGNHVWIGTGVIILKGVTIGNGAIIGAGSVVTNDIPAHCLAVGNPAKVIRSDVKWKL